MRVSGTHLGPYEILQPIGAGGMGQVYKARDTRLNRSKILPADDERRGSEKLLRLVERTNEAVRDHVKALSIAGVLRDSGTAEDHEAFLAVCWRVVGAERQCDQLLRDVRRALVRHVEDPVTLNLATDFAASIELATDALLATSYGVRELAFNRIGARR